MFRLQFHHRRVAVILQLLQTVTVGSHRIRGKGKPYMTIIVIGAGKVGFRIARQLVQESHDVVLIDIDTERLEPARKCSTQ